MCPADCARVPRPWRNACLHRSRALPIAVRGATGPRPPRPRDTASLVCNRWCSASVRTARPEIYWRFRLAGALLGSSLASSGGSAAGRAETQQLFHTEGGLLERAGRFVYGGQEVLHLERLQDKGNMVLFDQCCHVGRRSSLGGGQEDIGVSREERRVFGDDL